MSKEDEEKTSLITEEGTFLFTIMPFQLQNTKAYVERLMYIIFKKQIRQNMEAYFDDILVYSKKNGEHLADLEKTYKVSDQLTYI